MSFDVKTLFDEKSRQFGVKGSVRFTDDFIAGINKIQLELARAISADSAYTVIATLDDTCTVATALRDVVEEGINAELWARGYQQGSNFSTSFQLYQAKLIAAHGQTVKDLSDAADTDEEDFIGLGYLD